MTGRAGDPYPERELSPEDQHPRVGIPQRLSLACFCLLHSISLAMTPDNRIQVLMILRQALCQELPSSSQWTAMLPSVSNVHLLSWGLLRVSSLEENPALLGSQDCIWITWVSISKVSSKPHLIRLFHNFFSYSDAIDSSLISSLDLPIWVFKVFSFIVPSAYREGGLGRTAKCCLLLSWAMVNVFVLKFLWFYISFQ